MQREIPFSLLHQLVLKGLFMSVGTCSNEMLEQFVNSDVFQGKKLLLETYWNISFFILLNLY